MSKRKAPAPAKHTQAPTAGPFLPSPWIYDTDPASLHHGTIRMRGVIIAKVVTQSSHKPGEADANGHLMAASPELLAACESIIRVAENGDTIEPDLWILNRVREAIAKAKEGG